MKNAIVKLGFCLLFFCAAHAAYAVPPTVLVDRVTTTPTNSTTVNFIVKFSTTVNGFTNGDVDMSGPASGGLNATNVSVSANATPGWFNVQISGLTVNGALNISIPAGAATDATTPFDGSAVSTGGTPSVTFDNVGPTPTITKPGQPDPTTGSSQIKFTVTWDEPIFTTFPNSAIDLSGSDAGAGAVAVDHIAEIAPNNKTKYEVFINVPITATGNRHVKMIISAGTLVKDEAGNGNKVDSHAAGSNDVVYAGLVPQLETPPTAVPTPDGFIISGNVTDDGGLSGVQRGFVWKATSPVGTGGGDHKTQVGTGEGPFTGAAVTGLAAETQYFYNVWADNGVGGIVLSDEQSVYTVSATPGNHSPVTATTISSGRIDLTFTKFQGNPNADGLIILRQENSAPNDNDIKDGKAPVVAGTDMPLIIKILTGAADQNVASFQDNTVLPGKLYYYAVVPFSWDNSNASTYNYKAGFATDNTRAFSKSSFIGFNSAQSTLDYASATGTVTTTNGVDLGSFTLYDGDNIVNDTDGAATELDNLTIHIDNWTMIEEIAILDGGPTIHAKGTPNPATGDITFDLDPGDLVSGDNNTGGGSPDQFNIIATFKPANVVDGAVIKITVTAATTITGSSELVTPSGGAATTGPTKNAIDVIATKFVYTGVTDPVNSGALWGFTGTLKDDNNVVDTNIGGTVTVSEPSLDPPTTAVAEVTKPVINGVVVFTALKFSDAGSKSVNLNASNWAGTNNGTLPITVESLGVAIIGPGSVLPPTQKFCFNDASTTLGTFHTLDDIKIQESDKTDFAIGTGQTLSLMLPAGFVFDIQGCPAGCRSIPTLAKRAGGEVANLIFVGYTGNNIVRIQYDVTGNSNTNADFITISNLKVKYTGTTPVTSADILRVGGSAVQKKNADTDSRSHGKLSADSGLTTIDFVVNTVGFDPGETHFSKTGTPPIVLQGRNSGSNVPGVFSGTGVALDQDGLYKFTPAQLAPGVYDVVFTYTDASGEQCKSTVTKRFEVYTTIINGLNATLCIYDDATLTGPSNFIPGGYFFVTLIGYVFNPNLYTQYASNADPYVWYDQFPGVFRIIPPTSPGVYKFSPDDPIYAATLAAQGSVYVGYRKFNTFTGFDEYVYQAIFVNQRPVINFTPNLTGTGICSTDGLVNLLSPQFDAAGTFDEFWSSTPGNSNRPAGDIPGISGDRASGFKLTPSVANPAPGTSDVALQINYKHLDRNTGCSNQIAQVITVWRKPPQVPTALINIKGVSNDTSGEFCKVGDPITSFSISPPNGTMFYRWYDDAGTDEVATSGKTEYNAVSNVPSTAGVPNVGLYSFNITQTEHRTPFFAGCQSGLRPITVEVFAPTTISAGTPTTICEGNDVLLDDLHASITPPSGTLDGIWSSMHVTPGTFSPNNTFSTVNTPDATNYTPSAQEVAEGLVTLRLRSLDPSGPCGFVEAFVSIRINPGITVTFPVSPVSVCASAKDMPVEGTVSNSLLGFQWTSDGAGSFEPGSDTRSTTKYIPTAAELNDGADIILTLTTDDPDGPVGPCQVVANDVHLLISQRPIVAAGPDYEICADEAINVISRIPPTGNIVGDLTKSSASSVTWAHNGLGMLTDPTALATTYDVSGAAAAAELNNTTSITFTATSNTPGGANVCPAEKDQVTITLHPRPAAPTPIQPSKYCVGDVVDLLRVVGAYPTWYNNGDLASIHKIIEGNNEFATPVSANAEKRVPFWVTQTTDKTPVFAGCESTAAALMTIIVNPLPSPNFTFANQCLGDIMQFTNGSTLAQPQDPLEPARSITSYQWNFDDGLLNTDAGLGSIPAGTQGGATTGSYENPGHKFKDPGGYSVRVIATTSDQCFATFIHTPIPVGPIPVANFDAAKLCNADDTQFTSSSGLDPSVSTTYAWIFGDNATGANNLSAAKHPLHAFSGVDTYDVSLTITTDLNCTNTVIKEVSIFPYIKTFPYIENFETSNHGWVPEGKVTNGSTTTLQTSWDLLSSAGSIASDPNVGAGSTFWATHTNASPDTYYHNNERSVLYGPCVDMRNLQRPVIAIDYFNDTEEKGDGAYVEYLDESDPAAVWTRLGDNAGGLNWYNQSSIGGLSLLGDVGQNLSQFGWSGATDQWTTGRYNLDAFAGKTRLRFRVVFGSNFSPVNTDVFDGFALDYFRLETRNRVVLVENFTSKSASSAFVQNRDAFKTFPSASASNEVVKIEYHTGIPVVAGETPDPVFGQNPMDPNARASFYGLSAVPRGYIDGYSNLTGSGMFSGAWAGTYYSTESLKTSPLGIVINTPTITNGTLHVTGTVTATDIDLQSNKYSIYVAVVEETVGTDAYVLRKMLPSASGRKVPLTLKGQSFTFDESWSVDKSYLSDNPRLITVAFVQSDIVNADNERIVLQAAYNNNVPAVIFTTGIETPFLEQTAMFPNPADGMVNIELPQPTITGVEVNVIDQLGRPVLRSEIGVGQRSTSINTSNLAGAVYIVQLKENGISTARRLVITHRH